MLALHGWTLDHRVMSGCLEPVFAGEAVVQTRQTLRRFRDDVLVGLDLGDTEALHRVEPHRTLSADPESGPPHTLPTLIFTGRQDSVVGYVDQFALLPHYPRASFVVLDVAGHNLQFEQPELFDTLVVD